MNGFGPSIARQTKQGVSTAVLILGTGLTVLLAGLSTGGIGLLAGAIAVHAAVLVRKRTELTRRQWVGGAVSLLGLCLVTAAFVDGYTVSNIASERTGAIWSWVWATTIDRGGRTVGALAFERTSGTFYLPLRNLLAGLLLYAAGAVPWLLLGNRSEANR